MCIRFAIYQRFARLFICQQLFAAFLAESAELILVSNKRDLIFFGQTKLTETLVKLTNRFIEESIQEEMELTDGVAAIKEFESLSEDK